LRPQNVHFYAAPATKLPSEVKKLPSEVKKLPSEVKKLPSEVMNATLAANKEDQATGSRLKYGGNPDYLQARLRRDAESVAV
jgi:hypothetical protein